ncbi:MAG: transglycosylase SLT domain-containing protein [Alphaproteobacteria bacterium]|nr:transglycosylase SLT domain-containing protein [Alphaproteobacteria bacterium]
MVRSFWIAGLMVAAISLPAAAQTDTLIEGAKLCTRQMPRYEREYGIPNHLLSAIASTESGRYHRGLKITVPWPWTINVEGKGYYFDSKQEAIAAVKRYRAKGARSIDVGCMQVNLLHHPEAFASLEQAFDPAVNVAYAASFLRNLYEEEKSWKTAASHYHSKTPSRGTAYAGNVYNHWYTIVSRLRDARLQTGSESETKLAAAAPRPESPQPPAPVKLKPVAEQTAKSAPPKVIQVASKLPEQRGRQVQPHQAPRMNSITVTRQEDKRENGIIVMRPVIKVVDQPVSTPGVITLAQASNEIAEKPRPTRIEPQNAQAAHRPSGPRFVFDN